MKQKFNLNLKNKLESLNFAFMEFFKNQSASGILLLFCAIGAMFIANSTFSQTYEAILHKMIAVGIGEFTISMSFLHWVNDGLMAFFFFVIGMEIKREFLYEELNSLSATILPVVAAIGGMLAPAAIYVLFNYGEPTINGWGIPMGTDIAFALGVLSFAAGNAPRSIAIFLTALAIVDDLGAIIVIALFYTSGLVFNYLIAGFIVLGILILLNYYKVTSRLYRIIGGLILWFCFLQSGIHPTIAGVLLGLVIPAGTIDTFKDSMLYKFEHALTPWSSYLIMPIFALANAGIAFNQESFSNLLTPVGLGIILGLFIGKPLGIFISVYTLVKLKIVKIPQNATLGHFFGAGSLGGIGFTMSLFIASLAFSDGEYLTTAKAAIMTASLLSGVLGTFLFKLIYK